MVVVTNFFKAMESIGGGGGFLDWEDTCSGSDSEYSSNEFRQTQSGLSCRKLQGKPDVQQ